MWTASAGSNLAEQVSSVKRSLTRGGVKYPVLAWGGLGVSRVAMLKMGLRDLRQLYRSDVDWIRDTPMMQGGKD